MLALLQTAFARVCKAQNVKHRYTLYLVEFRDSTLIATAQFTLQGRCVANIAGIVPGCTLITAIDCDGKPVYQTSLPLIPKAGESYPVCIPADKEIVSIQFETFDANYKARSLGSVKGRNTPYIYKPMIDDKQLIH